MRYEFLAVLPVILLLLVCGGGCGKVPVSSIRLATGTPEGHSEKWAYGISVAPPWKDGGVLWANFPEHLEYGPQGMGIARYHDKRGNAWKVEGAGKFAHYEVASLSARGVKVEATAEVIDPDRVEFTLRIVNDAGRRTLDRVKPLLCFHYKTLTGFPGPKGTNFRYAYVVIDGEITALADIPAKNPETMVRGGTVKPHPPYRTSFVTKKGGWIEKPLDLALSVITSQDDRHAVILHGQPGRSVLSNRWIPCLHADPYYGDIKPGETRAGTVTAIFVEGDWRAEVKKIIEARKSSQE